MLPFHVRLACCGRSLPKHYELLLLNVWVHSMYSIWGKISTSGYAAFDLIWGQNLLRSFTNGYLCNLKIKFCFLLSESQAINGFKKNPFISSNLPALRCLCCFLFKLETHLLHSRCFKNVKAVFMLITHSFIHNSCINTERKSCLFSC